MLLLPAETLTRKHSHADSLGKKPLFADRSLGRKQESLDNLSRSRIKRTLSAGRENMQISLYPMDMMLQKKKKKNGPSWSKNAQIALTVVGAYTAKHKLHVL